MQIKFNGVSFTYNIKSSNPIHAINDISLDFTNDNYIALVGKTGSGKSTIAELINAFLTPNTGEVIVNNFINASKQKHRHKEIQELRKNIGFLFQFSENQLFEETVLKDVEFGVKNFYPKEYNFELYAKEAIKLVGLDDSFYNRSPFDLSGGEKKRVAIAGALSYRPKLLILDEPTAGLDARGKKEIMELFKKINETGVNIILITHDMEVANKYAKKIVVLHNGQIIQSGTPKEVFKYDVEKYNLDTPILYKVMHQLKAKGMKLNEDNIFDIDSLVSEIKKHG